MKIAYLKRSHIFVGLVACLSIGYQSLVMPAALCRRLLRYQPDFERFAQKYQPPVTLKTLIDANKGIFMHNEYYGIEGRFEAIPSVIFKGRRIDRIINAGHMNACMKDEKLDLLGVANKYFCEIDGEWTVIAEVVEPCEVKLRTQKKSLALIQQLAKVAEKTGFEDWGGADPNWIFNSHGRFVCVDTEESSFSRCVEDCVAGLSDFNTGHMHDL
jgi:hypothetical protein